MQIKLTTQKKRSIKIVSLLLAFSFAQAQEKDKPDLSYLNQHMKDTQIQSVKPSVINGLYEVIIEGRVAYVSKDGKHLILGNIFDVQSKTNLTEQSNQILNSNLFLVNKVI